MFDEEESIESDEGDREGGEEDARRLCCRHKLAHIFLSMCLLMALMRVFVLSCVSFEPQIFKGLTMPGASPQYLLTRSIRVRGMVKRQRSRSAMARLAMNTFRVVAAI